MGGYHDSTGKFIQTETRKVQLPLGSFWLAAGTALAAFADAASPTPGYALDNSEAVGIRWNNHATPSAIFTQVLNPRDRKPGTPLTIKGLVSKSGATVGDATTFTVGAFFNQLGALHDADADAGGASNAIVGNATAKTVQQVSRNIASTDIPDADASLTLSVKPTDGLLGTDDITLHALWLEYERNVTAA